MSYGHRNSLLGEQVSLCGGLYAPTQKEEDSNHDSGSDQDKENQTIMGEPPWNTTSIMLYDKFHGCGLARYLYEEVGKMLWHDPR
mmetsp:Transcript_20312/g.42516  ORF Transcript_20312/g.42516 Transcript_20312/m.42516 type:complete len:85 (-) Transcript_20312:792-1046(-)